MPSMPGNDVHLVVGHRERPLHQRAERFRHALLDLEPDDEAAAALLQRALEEADEVLRLFLHFDVGVADRGGRRPCRSPRSRGRGAG